MNIKRLISLAALFAAVVITAAGPAQAQWLGEWSYRRPVDISSSSGETLTDCQARVPLDSSFDFSKAEAGGSDIRFTSSDGSTRIPYWIEEWDAAGGTACLWVRLPELPTEGTTVYMYYGNPAAADNSSGEGTFVKYDGFEDYALGSGNPGEWDRYPGNPIITEGASGAWDDHGATFASVIWDEAAGEFRMYYHGFTMGGAHQIGLATAPSPEGPWTKYSGNPVLTPGPGSWDAHSVRVPMVWKEGSDYHMIYTGYSGSAYQIGYAYSSDGINWTKHASNPVFNDPTWCHDQTENWGVMKVGSEYLMWYSSFGTRQSGIAVSSDLVNWAPHQTDPIFATSGDPGDDRYSQYCPFSFKYGEYYYVLVPSYDNSWNYSKFYMYRSSSPYFPESDRHLVRIAHTVAQDGEWDDHDNDTPFVLTMDIERTQFYNDELWCYYASEGGADYWKEGLLIETDIASALSDAPLPGLFGNWSVDGDIAVVDDPVRQGERAVRQHDPSTGSSTQLSAGFTAMETGGVGAWMRRGSTSSGDYDIYLYGNGGSVLSCVAGLGRNGDFHYWNGSFQATGVNWAVDTWYLVNILFNAGADVYDFAVYGSDASEILRVEAVACGNTSFSMDRAMFYTSGGYVGDCWMDDFRIQQWSGAEPAATVGEEQTELVDVLCQEYSAWLAGSRIRIAWTLSSDLAASSIRIFRAASPGGMFEKIMNPSITREGLSYSFIDEAIEPGGSYRYRTEAATKEGSVVLLFETDAVATPSMPVTLFQNSPNPFNPVTTIRYYLPYRSSITLEVYDSTGRRVAALIDNKSESKGFHSMEWNGLDGRGNPVSSGLYFSRLKSDKTVKSGKMVLLR